MPKGSGRRPKPTALRELEGNRGKRPINPDEPKPEPGEPEMPSDLLPFAREEWARIVPELLKLGVLAKVDRAALAGYCMAYARWRQAEDDIAKYGLTIEEPVFDGNRLRRMPSRFVVRKGKRRRILGALVVRLKANPAAAKSSDALKAMKSFLIEFGMTPASRSRLSTTDPNAGPEANDPAAKYLEPDGSGHPIQ